MLKYWIKNRLLFDIAISIVLALLFCFAFVFPSSSNHNSISKENSIYLNSDIDFQIPNPSRGQLSDIASKDFVSNVFGYYLTKTNITGNSNAKVNLLMSDNMSSLAFTMFNEQTKLDSTTNPNNYAYLDEVAASKLSVSVGDNIFISLASQRIDFVVSAIYKANSLFEDGTVLIAFEGLVKSTYEANAHLDSYAAAFIDASNVEACNNYLRSYIPFGRLKDRMEFDTDEAYELYNTAIMSGNYSNEITNFSEYRNNANRQLAKSKTTLTTMSYIGSLAVGVLYFVACLVLRSRKSEDKYFKEVLKDKKTIGVYRTVSILFSAITYLGFVMLLSAIINIVNVVIIPLIISLILYLVTYIVNHLQDKKYL